MITRDDLTTYASAVLKDCRAAEELLRELRDELHAEELPSGDGPSLEGGEAQNAGRALSIAMTKLDEASLWICRVIHGLGGSVDKW